MLAQEADLPSLDDQSVFRQINTCLIAAQHVQSEQQIYTFALEGTVRDKQ